MPHETCEDLNIAAMSASHRMGNRCRARLCDSGKCARTAPFASEWATPTILGPAARQSLFTHSQRTVTHHARTPDITKTRCPSRVGNWRCSCSTTVFAPPSAIGSIDAPSEPHLVIGGAPRSLAVSKHAKPTLLSILLTTVLSVTFASAQSNEVIRDQITLRGKVEAVDHTARTVTIRGDRGNVVTLDMPRATTSDQLQVGDVVSVAYYDRVSLRPKPAWPVTGRRRRTV